MLHGKLQLTVPAFVAGCMAGLKHKFDSQVWWACGHRKVWSEYTCVLRPATFSRLDVFITSQRLVLKVVIKLGLHVKSEKVSDANRL